ncbi:MAG: helix-turn-helix transcriptional regulator [Lachnospiraceae bacterium]|nr:helix-turn-helix transcriptional regulator [Lachnospiraceae bacterium]MDY4969254.1 helix-turn-helix transcriptional regulator [Lachnospiraceae bacterium]
MSLPWDSIHDFLLHCGSQTDPYSFSEDVLDQIGKLIPFDQGRLYFLDDNGKVRKEHCIGVDKKIVQDYHNYYSGLDDGCYSTASIVKKYTGFHPPAERCVKNSRSYGENSRFFDEYVQANHIRHSFGLGLWDMGNSLKCLFSLDRTCDIDYNIQEVKIMECIQPHLNNFFKNYYYQIQNLPETHVGECPELTRREKEIAALLVNGVTPQNISRKLYISITTVNKHIANMHAKLGVSTRQELIVKLVQIYGTHIS